MGKAKLKKGKYYKFIVVAYDKNNKVLSTSKVAHIATKGDKYGNPTRVIVEDSVKKEAKALKVGKTLKLKPRIKVEKIKKHRDIIYESTNTKIATVSKNGVVRAKAKGTCYVCVYAQDGARKTIKIVVK